MLSPDFMMTLALLLVLVGTLTLIYRVWALERVRPPLPRTVRTLMSMGMFSLSGFFTLRVLSDHGISVAVAPLLSEVFWALGIMGIAGGFIARMFALAHGPRQPSLPQRELPHDA
jgi:hypothetical protein